MNRFSIDDVNLYEVLGRDKIVEPSTCFYNKVYADTEPSFRGQFPKDKDGAIQNQYEFLIQRFHGPEVYSERKGHPALRARHDRFAITRPLADKWLAYMRRALDHESIPADARARLDEYFTESAYFLQNVGDDGQRLY